MIVTVQISVLLVKLLKSPELKGDPRVRCDSIQNSVMFHSWERAEVVARAVCEESKITSSLVYIEFKSDFQYIDQYSLYGIGSGFLGHFKKK